MTLTREDPALARPVEDEAQLIEFFRSGEKPPEDWRIGTEHEKVGLYRDTLKPIPYEGERGLGALLAELEREHGFSPLFDAGRVVGLEREGTSITLEPGGQLELSGAPLLTLHETCREFHDHLALMKHCSEPFGMVWLGLGIHPLASVDELPRMPRERYTIMREYLEKRGSEALEMMHGTGSVQVNLDYGSEADLARKLRVALAASPVVTALYANSSISRGEPNGFISRRAWVWRHTDPHRTGLLPFVFDERWGEDHAYRGYLEWALDVPMLFILREERHLPMQGLSFRDYLAHGHERYKATLADWNLHLTTLFPEVRLKRVVEMRSADAVPPGLVCALPAFWKGLLYDEDALGAAWARLRDWRFEDVDRLHAEVARAGLEARTPEGPMPVLAKELVDLAARGLKSLDHRNRAGEDERLFLDPLYEILDRGTSPGRYLLECWDGAWGRRTDLLVEYSKY